MKKTVHKEPRDNKITVTLSDRELEAIDKYCRKYKSTSRTSVIREGAMRFVMGKFVEDYPTLFGKNDLDRLIVTDSEEIDDYIEEYSKIASEE